MKLETLRKRMAQRRRNYGRIVVMTVRPDDLFFAHGEIEIFELPYKAQDSSSGSIEIRQSKKGYKPSRRMSAFEKIALERGGTVTDLKTKG